MNAKGSLQPKLGMARTVVVSVLVRQLLPQIAMMVIIFVELEAADELFALVEHFVHLAYTLHFHNLIDQRVELALNVGLEPD